ncbi:DsbA family oxidoreductase [Spirosoma pollinicola]|uniref:Disulfide bond formation protein DsbA n=1 Tax=Spirosoma pollinicola TaxID=2057025 RepID=A0A2K8Z7Q5_9BACT|nr:DsbA family oxidoreductase [Spirosoma pollinicola]AUD05849.1 disulfide bond formation protein DsbA [Spirosoma pollinicola]
MDVEIWSDIMCPFCYIGKRKFEHALSQFPHKDQVNIVWKSFQLNPDMQTEPGKNINQYLSEIKGWSLDEAKQMNDRVTAMAQEVGLSYDFDKAVVANSFDAHRLIQLAKQNGLGDAIEERLFKAYFTEGRDTSDHDTLVELGTEIGLDATVIQQMLAGTEFTEAVHGDVYEAQQVGARGVPFFVLNRRYAVSGAQQPETFLGALDTAWAEWAKTNPVIPQLTADGPTCTPGEIC